MDVISVKESDSENCTIEKSSALLLNSLSHPLSHVDELSIHPEFVIADPLPLRDLRFDNDHR